MYTIQNIIDYVMESPQNTNRAVLASMLGNIESDSEGEGTLTHLNGSFSEEDGILTFEVFNPDLVTEPFVVQTEDTEFYMFIYISTVIGISEDDTIIFEMGEPDIVDDNCVVQIVEQSDTPEPTPEPVELGWYEWSRGSSESAFTESGPTEGVYSYTGNTQISQATLLSKFTYLAYIEVSNTGTDKSALKISSISYTNKNNTTTNATLQEFCTAFNQGLVGNGTLTITLQEKDVGAQLSGTVTPYFNFYGLSEDTISL